MSLRTLGIPALLGLLTCEVLLPAWWQQARIIAALCLLSVGVLHGSFDELLARKVIPQSRVKFYLSYLAAAATMLLSLYLSPSLTLCAFLLLSAFHFGEEELLTMQAPRVVALVRGASYFTPALLLHPQQVAPILSEMGVVLPTLLYAKALPLCLTLFAFDFLYASSQRSLNWKLQIETWCFWLIALVAHPLVSFSIYFTLKHSREHLHVLLRQWLCGQAKGKVFLQASPVVLVTSLGCGSFYFLSGSLSAAVLGQVFVALAALSLPHAYLVHLAALKEPQASLGQSIRAKKKVHARSSAQIPT